MDTKDIVDKQAEKNTKSTKSRLDELKELYEGEYVTENEFKVARINILEEGGIDVVTQLRQNVPQVPVPEEDEEPKGSGCGCFIAALLAAFIVLGVSFFAAPYWPDRFGGVTARTAREWFTAKGTAFIDRFFGDQIDSAQIYDPISSEPGRPEIGLADVTYPGIPETIQASPEEISSDITPVQPNEANESVESAAFPPLPVIPDVDHTGDVTLPSLDMHILSLPDSVEAGASPEPDIAVVEMQAPASTVSNQASSPVPSVPSGNENARRGHISARNARIRSAPDTSTNDNVVGRGVYGDRFTVLEERVGRDGSKWYHIMYEDGNKSGWVSGSLVRLER